MIGPSWMGSEWEHYVPATMRAAARKRLTATQLEHLAYWVVGFSTQTAAVRLRVSESTVRDHRYAVRRLLPEWSETLESFTRRPRGGQPNPTRSDPPHLAGTALTPREADVLRMWRGGLSAQRTALVLGVSRQRVGALRRALRRKSSTTG